MNDSYIQVSAKIAYERANLRLHAITHTREREWSSRILEEMARRGRARFWMPWIKPLSIVQARQRIKDESESVRGRYSPDHIDWRREERCQRVMKMAEFALEEKADGYAPATLYLSSEDLEHISCT